MPSARHRVAALAAAAAVVTLALPATGAAAAPAARRAVVAVPAGCTAATTGPDGSPAAVTAQAPVGVHLWLDAASWHLRFTDPASRSAVLTGQLQACAPVQVATSLMQGTDTVRRSPDQTSVALTLTDTGGLDGLEFNASCPTTWTFAFQLDGQPVPADEIYLGSGGVHPPASTFALPSCSVADLRALGITPAVTTGPTFSPLLLAIEAGNAAWRALDLPVAGAPLFGNGVPAIPGPVHGGHGGWVRSAATGVGVVGESVLAISIAGAWYAGRRRRRTA